jgi:arylsulfatase A-like enzyme
VAEEFAQLGYNTGGFHSNPFLDERYGWGRGFDEYFNGSFSKKENQIKQGLHSLVSKSDTAKRWARRALSFLGRRIGRDMRGGSEPYVPAETLNRQVEDWLNEQHDPVFLWIHYMDVHNPWYPRAGTASEAIDQRELLQTFYKARESPEALTESERETLRCAYRGSVQYFDRELNRCMDLLEAELSDPVFCLTSDHGELFGENGMYFHPGVLEPELLRVPMMFSEGGLSSDAGHLASLVDVVPTLLSLADSSTHEQFDGVSLISETERQEIFASARDSVRIITEEGNSEHTIEEAQDIEWVSQNGRSHIQRLSNQAVNDSITRFEDDDLDEQLKALGYK